MLVLDALLADIDDYTNDVRERQSKLAAQRCRAIAQLKSLVGATAAAKMLRISRERVYQAVRAAKRSGEPAAGGEVLCCDEPDAKGMATQIRRLSSQIERCRKDLHLLGVERALRLIQLLQYEPAPEPRSSLCFGEETDILSDLGDSGQQRANLEVIAGIKRQIRGKGFRLRDPELLQVLQLGDKDAALVAETNLEMIERGKSSPRLTPTHEEAFRVIKAWADSPSHNRHKYFSPWQKSKTAKSQLAAKANEASSKSTTRRMTTDPLF